MLMLSLLHLSELVEWPDAPEDAADDLLLGDAANGCIPRVDGDGPVVSHHKDSRFGHLVRKFDVRLAKRLFGKVGFVERHPVDGHIARFIDVDPFTRLGDHTLHQNLIIVVKGNNITPTYILPLFSFPPFSERTMLPSEIEGCMEFP